MTPENTSPVGIALGSNLGDPLANLREARRQILALPGIGEPVLCSRLYRTAPVNCPPGSPDFLNALIEITLRPPESGSQEVGQALENLLIQLQQIEQQMQRAPLSGRAVNAPRPIDLDIIYASDLVYQSGTLTIPHPRAAVRAFVLQPLADIRPDLILPGSHQIVRKLLPHTADFADLHLQANSW